MKKVLLAIVGILALTSTNAQWENSTFSDGGNLYAYVNGDVVLGPVDEDRVGIFIAKNEDGNFYIKLYNLAKTTDTHYDTFIIFNNNKSTMKEYEVSVSDDKDGGWIHGDSNGGTSQDVMKYYDAFDNRAINNLISKFKTNRFMHIKLVDDNGPDRVIRFDLTNAAMTINKIIQASANPF